MTLVNITNKMSVGCPIVGEMRDIVASAGIMLTDSKHAILYDMGSGLIEMAVAPLLEGGGLSVYVQRLHLGCQVDRRIIWIAS